METQEDATVGNVEVSGEDVESLRMLFSRAFGKDFEKIGDTQLPDHRDSITGSDGYLRMLLRRLYHREFSMGNPVPHTLGDLARTLSSFHRADDDAGEQVRAVEALSADPQDLPRYATGFYANRELTASDTFDMLDYGLTPDVSRLSRDASVIAAWRLQRGL